MFFRYKSNGARLRRLIIDVGSETIRKFFDSICPPPKLKAILNDNRELLNHLQSTRVIRDEQMKVLFPPEGMPPTTSKDYDIMLLFVLLRTICGLRPPSGGWNEKPTGTSKEADLVRIKYYINKACNHRESLEVNDHDFSSYWDEISDALKRLGANCEDIKKLKTSPIDEDYYTNSINMFLKNTARKTAQLIDNITSINTVQLSVLEIVVLFLATSVLFWSFQQRPPHYLLNEPDYSNPGFVGREWVFRQIEQHTSNTRGVLLVAEPGWGKSAIIKRLISSSSSSAVIHENIIGYHFCKYNDKSTRDGGNFVKNLVQLIGKKIPKYKEIIKSNQLINILKSNCNDNPVKCFQTAIVEPLKDLDSTGRKNSFILIDALDECVEKEESHQSIIRNILYKKVPDLPNWVKLIVTSRNHPLATTKMSKNVQLWNLSMCVDNESNTQDLHTYASQALRNIINETSSSEEILRVDQLIDHTLNISKGNFLFLKTIIQNWQKYPDKINKQFIPESLEERFATSFTDRFETKHLKRFEPFLEILLATYSPLTLFQLEDILKDNFGKDYNTREVANSLSEYFKNGIDQRPLEFYHQSFAKWLVNQTAGLNGIYIQKERGHYYIADYLLNFYEGRQTCNVTFQELSELCTHFLHGKQESVSMLKRLATLKVSKIRGFCILHDLAPKRDATKLLSEFIKQFNSVDILDFRGWTPAMYAVQAGNIENVKLFIDNKANLNYVVEEKFVKNFRQFVITPDSTQIDSMISIAAHRGYFDIINLLIERGANIEKADYYGRKPLHFAGMMGHFKIAQLFIDKGVQPDVISLHHAATRNHTEIVRLLLNAGVRDECLPCKSENISLCSISPERLHLCVCETALYAAVTRNNVEMAKLILQYSNSASVNCRHGSGRTALMEAFSQKNIQMVELLINAGADTSAECESPLTDLVYDCSLIRYKNITVDDLLYSLYCSQYVCDGNRVIDFSFAYGLWEVMATYISNIEFYSSFLNVRWNPLTVAAIYDQVDFIKAMYGSAIKYIKTLLRNAVVCRSVRTLAYILRFKGNDSFTIEYKDGKTLLHLAILGSRVYVCRKLVTHADIGNKKRLRTVKLLTMVPLDINKQDKYGRTALHYAVIQVLPKIVKHLVKVGAHWRMKDKRGDTALEYAIRERPYLHNELLLPCQWTSDYVSEVCQSTVFDKLASYLLRLGTITKCDVRAKKLLDGLLHHRLPLSLYSLFDSGLDVNCAQRHFRRVLKESVFDVALNLKYREIREVFKIFKINVHVTCDLPFAQSELHLMAYLRSFRNHDQLEMVKSKGNLFQPTMDGSPFPLQRFVSSNPDGVKILNKCYDKEGYLAIHRAVQGKVLDAVSWFVENGVDINTKTKTGLTALDFAIYNLPGHHLYNVEGVIFKKLLDKMQENGGAFFRCNTKHVDLSPLHVAASRGITLMELIHDEIPGLPLNCTNSDGIRPIYLAHLYHATDYFFRSDRQAFRNLNLSAETGPSKFPQREVEYHLIYNQFYRTPQGDLRNVLNDYELFGCPGINELLPHKTEIQRRITVCTERCLLLAFEACRQFSCSFPNLNVQKIVWNASPHNFMDITAHISKLQFHLMKKFPFISMSLWRNVMKAHSCAQNCSCFEVMLLLQERFTSDPREDKNVGKFVAERMRWTDTSRDGDVKYRWPFGFLLKKALKKDKAYEYLNILSPKEELSSYSKSAA